MMFLILLFFYCGVIIIRYRLNFFGEEKHET